MNKSLPTTSTLNIQQIRGILDAIDECMVFVLAPTGGVILQNEFARQHIAPWTDANAWLNGPFHDVQTCAILKGMNSVVNLVATPAPDSARFRAAYLDHRLAERILHFRITHLGFDDLRLLTVTECTDHLRDGRDDITASRLDLDQFSHDMGNIFGIIQLAAEGIDRASSPHMSTSKVTNILESVQRGSYLLERVATPGILTSRDNKTANFSKSLQRACVVFERVLPASIAMSVRERNGILVVGCSNEALESALIGMLCCARKNLLTNQSTGGRINVSASLTKTDAILKISVRNTQAIHAEKPAEYPLELFRLVEDIETTTGGQLIVSNRENTAPGFFLRLSLRLAKTSHQPKTFR